MKKDYRISIEKYHSPCKTCGINAFVHWTEFVDLYANNSCHRYMPSDPLEYVEMMYEASRKTL